MEKDKNFFHGHSRLAEERAKLWATQQLAADFFGVSRVTWGQCERGNATPSGDVLAGLAQQGADVLYILTGQPTPRLKPGKDLNAEEETLLEYFRGASDEVRRAALGALVANAKVAPASTSKARDKAQSKNQSVFRGQVGQVVDVGGNLNQTGISFFSTEGKK